MRLAACGPRPRPRRPPMPASTSSNTSVLPGASRLATDFRASRMRDSSPPGGDARQRPQLLARVRREQELRRLEARARSSSACRPRRRRRRLGRRSGPGTASSPWPAAPSSPATLLLELARRPRGACARARWPLQVAAARSCLALLREGRARAPRASRARASSARQRCAEGEHLLDGRAVLALQPLDQGQPALDLVEPARADLQRLAVVAQEQGEVLELGLHGGRAPRGSGAKRGSMRASSSTLR